MSRITNAARHVITKCGKGNFSKGVEFVSAVTGIHEIQVRRWTYPREKGGAAGLIPSRHHGPILAEARRRRIRLTPDDFFAARAA